MKLWGSCHFEEIIKSNEYKFNISRKSSTKSPIYVKVVQISTLMWLTAESSLLFLSFFSVKWVLWMSQNLRFQEQAPDPVFREIESGSTMWVINQMCLSWNSSWSSAGTWFFSKRLRSGCSHGIRTWWKPGGVNVNDVKGSLKWPGLQSAVHHVTAKHCDDMVAVFYQTIWPAVCCRCLRGRGEHRPQGDISVPWTISL